MGEFLQKEGRRLPARPARQALRVALFGVAGIEKGAGGGAGVVVVVAFGKQIAPVSVPAGGSFQRNGITQVAGNNATGGALPRGQWNGGRGSEVVCFGDGIDGFTAGPVVQALRFHAVDLVTEDAGVVGVVVIATAVPANVVIAVYDVFFRFVVVVFTRRHFVRRTATAVGHRLAVPRQVGPIEFGVLEKGGRFDVSVVVALHVKGRRVTGGVHPFARDSGARPRRLPSSARSPAGPER